jgi:hypothetical protein
VHKLLMKFILALVPLIAVWPAQADDVPVLNLELVCRGIAQQSGSPGQKGGPDLTLAQCIKSEQAVRE